MSVQVYRDPAELAAAAAALVARRASAATRPFTLGLAGGNTPRATYERLAELDVPWGNVTMWLGDERWVPHDNEESNTLMVRRALVDPVVGKLLSPNTAYGTPEDSAADYEATLDGLFADHGPDLILLGTGADGHTASLFPGTGALDASDRRYVANWVPARNAWRLTATIPLLGTAAELVFVVSGVAKAAILSRIIDDGADLPAGLVARRARKVHWLLDAAAASQLDPKSIHSR